MALSNLKTLFKGMQGMGLEAALRAVQYKNNVRALNHRYARHTPHGKFQTPGRVAAVEQRSRSLIVQAERAYIEIHLISPEIIRVRMKTDANFTPPFSYAVDRIDWPPPTLLVNDNGPSVTIKTENILCRVHKNPYKLSFESLDGRAICEDAEGVSWRDHEIRWTRQLPQQEWCYGLGQRASTINQRGKRVSLWNADPLPGYPRDADPIYTSIPFYIGFQPDFSFGILWDNPARGYVDVGATKANEMSFEAEEGELRFYFFAGPTLQAVLKQYTSLTGRMVLPPLWALGFHQARWGYDSDAVYRKLAQEFRARQLPCDVLYFDIDYMDGYRSFTWDRTRFTLMPTLLGDLQKQGFKSVAILDPGIKTDPDYPTFQTGTREDVFLKYPDGKPVTAPVWPGNCHFPDFTSAKVRAWWAEQIPILTQAGFAGLWNDMNEPSPIAFQRGTTLPDYVVHDWDGAGQTHVGGGHNVYGMLMARASREGLQKQRPDKRPFVITRAAYAGAQRYASTWTGDNTATWEHLRLSLSMVLNAGLSGMAFTGPDIGGFAGDPDPELYIRWFQLGSMLPYFRVHSMMGTASHEPWAFGEKIEQIARNYLELRYRLLPYFYSAFAQCAHEGLPIVRPLLMYDPEDEELRGLDDVFMVGDSILIAPILEPGAEKRDLYLPKGVWYEYDTGKLIDGSRTVTAAAPLERMPIYIKAGRVIPMWPVMQYVGEKPIEESILRVYAGSGDTTFYEDAGEGLGYQRGEYRWSYFTCKFLPSGQFAIEWRRAGQYQPPFRQWRVEIVGISADPERVLLDGQSAPIWYYEGGVVEFAVQPFTEARIAGRGHAEPSRTLPRAPHR
ncbi:MAG: glycoside hydrolase family 31 protein [Chloroflexi bacterium]|nr:glycoside hydrolase family 31 protein [Chloroflexota bacterium]